MDDLLSVRQVAYMLKVHPLSVRRYIKTGKLTAMRVGGNVRITQDALKKFEQAVTYSTTPTYILAKTKKTEYKTFDNNDPFLRLDGRGAAI